MGQRRLNGEQWLAWRRQQLARGGSSTDFDWLVDLAGGLSWQQQQQLRLHPDQPVVLTCDLPGIETLWQRHLQTHEPLQYLVGRCPWRDLELAVGPGVLIPRQETELLVEWALELASPRPALWADLGTGSGCVALALARAWPGSRGWAVDLSAEALRQAAFNLEQAGGGGAQVQLLAGSWWEPLRAWWGQLELVVSNPPYIPTAVWANLDPVVREHEPALALDGGSDGLDALRLLAEGAATALAPGGVLVLEHHHDQSDAVLDLLAMAGLEQVQRRADLEGKRRFASARRRPIQPLHRSAP
ncbi:peptide chain release factor N(5)-glutamine methyltransferase [Cyanobium sp. FACHB-13342]|uniref:peptide chain release factor N(5)-glutamine methyltransferase n=1 Tax=Cyanobium sp. FACHB-13342 TaxID=2692793 RepID=UPI0016802AAB|nr:peptide chain release factor N(5)-glutamine methyltransferase [Cyanobium sp. FACHB-13342]MBD2424345.1 peptide chain release factor N(5)-glutamine methyltransferase [Cyanobium sp. FACHB-13342]